MKRVRELHRPPEPDPKVMSFVDHLQELRRRLIVMVISIVICSIIGWVVEPWVFDRLASPLLSALKSHHNFIDKVTYSSIVGAFTLKLKLAIIAGIVLSIPVLVQQIWGFVVPALPKALYRYGPYVMVSGVVLFVAGALTGYEIMPLAINFFISQGTSGDRVLAGGIELHFLCQPRLLVFGIAFEMPLVLVILCLVSVTDSGLLWRKRVIAFFAIFAT